MYLSALLHCNRSLFSISFMFFPLHYTQPDQQYFYASRIANGKGRTHFLVRMRVFLPGFTLGSNTVLSVSQRAKLIKGDFGVCN